MRLLLTAFLAISLVASPGCATVKRVDAAADIHALLVAIRDGDKPAFDRHVDRPALRAQLRGRLLAEVARDSGPTSAQAFAAVLAGPVIDLGVEALVQPSVFRAAAQRAGYSTATPIPNVAVIAREIRPLQGQRVCVFVDRRCTFVFKNLGGTWKLIAFEGDITAIRKRLGR